MSSSDISQHLHNIIQIHNNVMWDWQHSTKYSQIFPTFKPNVGNIWEFFMESYQSHKTLNIMNLNDVMSKVYVLEYFLWSIFGVQ